MIYTYIVHNNFHTDDDDENAMDEETEGTSVDNNKKAEDQMVCEVNSYLEEPFLII